MSIDELCWPKDRSGRLQGALSVRALNVLSRIVIRRTNCDWDEVGKQDAECISNLTAGIVGEERNCGPKTTDEIMEFIGPFLETNRQSRLDLIEAMSQFC